MKKSPRAKKTPNDPVMPTVVTRIGNRNAMMAFATQRTRTQKPIPKPRSRSGNSSDKQTQTGTFKASCMQNTKATTKTRITYARST